MQPRPESRIKSLENRATAIEAKIEEMADDTAEEFKALRQDIKALNDDQKASFKQIGDTIIAVETTIRDELDEKLTAMEGRIDGKMVAMESRINQNIADLKTGLLEALRNMK